MNGLRGNQRPDFAVIAEWIPQGARVLDLAQWIEVDADYAADLAEKRRLLREAPTQVLACLPQGQAGSREVLALLESHLPRYFPALTPSVESADETLHPLAQAALKGQEDLCVMSLEQGEWVLTAAAVCFRPFHRQIRPPRPHPRQAPRRATRQTQPGYVPRRQRRRRA